MGPCDTRCRRNHNLKQFNQHSQTKKSVQQEHRPVLHSPVWTFVPYPPDPGWWVITGFDILDIRSCVWTSAAGNTKEQNRRSHVWLFHTESKCENIASLVWLTHTPSEYFTHAVRRGVRPSPPDAHMHMHACKRLCLRSKVQNDHAAKCFNADLDIIIYYYIQEICWAA